MLTVFSPAKINLFLRVLGKRSDGYHEISSLFQTVDLGDTLHIQLSDQDELTCTDETIPTDASNLILKAIHLFRQKTGVESKFKVHLNKSIPIQAGLGGGSSNAASTLWALNELTKSRIPLYELQNWSAAIGSDVPFFFSHGTAYCTGRGEVIYPLSPLVPPATAWVVKPKHIALSTPEMYKSLQAHPFQEEQSGHRQDLNYLLSGILEYVNDFERPAFSAKPELMRLKASLMQGGFETVLMTGSGSAFFCLGQGQMPQIDHLSVFPVHFIHRGLSGWYQKATIG